MTEFTDTGSKSTEQRWRPLIYIGILVLALLSNIPLYTGQFRGEDEALQLSAAGTILSDISPWQGFESIRRVANTFSIFEQPPVRYILTFAGTVLFPSSEFGTRFASIVISLIMTLQVVSLGRKLGGSAVGYISGLLIACSGFYNWTSMAFGWSVIVSMLLVVADRMLDATFDLSDQVERKRFRQINAAIAVAFLVNTGCVLFFGSIMLIYLCFNFRRMLKLILITLPFAFFYFAYYFYFLFFVSWYARTVVGDMTSFGQLRHNMDRAGSVYLSAHALIENLRGLNAYLLPFVSWILLALAVLEFARYRRMILVWFAPFMLAWSFLLQVQSQQYFILCFMVFIPFAVNSCVRMLGRTQTVVLMALVIPCVALWNYNVFIRIYRNFDESRVLLEKTFATASRQHNVRLPYEEAGSILDGIPGKFAHDMEGCFTLFYYTDRKDGPELKEHSRRFLSKDGKPCILAGPVPGTCLLGEEFRAEVNSVVTMRQLRDSDFVLLKECEPSGLRIYVRKGLL